MSKNKDELNPMDWDDLLAEEEAIDRELENSDVGEMPPELKQKIKLRLDEQIEEYERKRVYEQLSEDDKKALDLGRKMLEGKAEKEKVVYRKKKKSMYVALAAVLVLVLALGATSVGGPEKVIEKMKSAVGSREVVKVNTDEDNYIVEIDKEEDAYQEIKDVFGVDPVKIVHWPGNVRFLTSKIDEEMQLATLIYEYEEYNTQFYISSHHTDSSWGIDVEDPITDQYSITHDVKGEIEIIEYEIKEINKKRYSSRFSYNGMEYFLIGIMEKQDFEFLIKNLKIF